MKEGIEIAAPKTIEFLNIRNHLGNIISLCQNLGVT